MATIALLDLSSIDPQPWLAYFLLVHLKKTGRTKAMHRALDCAVEGK